jgi:hypothetical protein
MKRAEIIKHLADSERDVSEHTANVERQRAHVQDLYKAGASQAEIDEAFSGMIALEERLSLLERDRDWFAQALKSANE